MESEGATSIQKEPMGDTEGGAEPEGVSRLSVWIARLRACIARLSDRMKRQDLGIRQAARLEIYVAMAYIFVVLVYYNMGGTSSRTWTRHATWTMR
jgi:hypothetical protein